MLAINMFKIPGTRKVGWITFMHLFLVPDSYIFGFWSKSRLWELPWLSGKKYINSFSHTCTVFRNHWHGKHMVNFIHYMTWNNFDFSDDVLFSQKKLNSTLWVFKSYFAADLYAMTIFFIQKLLIPPPPPFWCTRFFQKLVCTRSHNDVSVPDLCFNDINSFQTKVLFKLKCWSKDYKYSVSGSL